MLSVCPAETLIWVRQIGIGFHFAQIPILFPFALYCDFGGNVAPLKRRVARGNNGERREGTGRYIIVRVAGARVLITARQIGGFASNANVIGTLFTGVESCSCDSNGALKSLEDLQKKRIARNYVALYADNYSADFLTRKTSS